MADWEGDYEILGTAGAGSPLDFLDWPAPAAADVMSAAGVSQGLDLPVASYSMFGGADRYAKLSAPPAPGSKYPALGLDPAPGDPGEIERLVSALSKAADRLGTAQSLIQRMADDKDSWQGEAAEAFHAKLKDELPKYLEDGSKSLHKAANDLRGWGTRLDGYRTKAQACEADASTARGTFGTAWTSAIEVARSHQADLQLQGKHFDTDAELQQANTRIQTALSSIEDAVSTVDSAFSALQTAIRQAKSLADTHHDDASSVAKSLRSDASDIAPHKPNPIVNWLKEHGGDILSAAAAVCGVLALFCPVFAIPAILLSAGALGMHAWKMASDGAKLWPPTSMEALGNWATLGCDALGAIPGIGVTAKAAGLMKDAAEAGELAGDAARATDGAEAAVKAGEGAAEGASEAGDAAESEGEKAANFFQRWGDAARERAGGDAAVNPWMQSKLGRLIDGQGKDLSDAAVFAGKAIQFNVNATGAAFATANLFPSAAGDDSFLNTNTVVTGGADALAGRGAATDLAEVARSVFRR